MKRRSSDNDCTRELAAKVVVTNVKENVTECANILSQRIRNLAENRKAVASLNVNKRKKY